jgi:undecaprenyl phosphate-alpha-L-ara4FN deformylase
MARTGAPALYGWRTMLYGLVLPSPVIGESCAVPLRRIAAAPGQELGLHAWDHRTWQDRLDDYPASWARAEIARGIAGFQKLYGRAPDCFAAAAWKVSPAAMAAWADAKPRWQSDCRVEAGDALPFIPTRGRFQSPIPQLPTNTPTLDEILGREVTGERVTLANWPAVYAREWAQRTLVCHTIHVEGEGRVYLPRFAELLRGLKRDGWRFATGGEVITEHAGRMRTGSMDAGTVAGRHGSVAVATIDPS